MLVTGTRYRKTFISYLLISYLVIFYCVCITFMAPSVTLTASYVPLTPFVSLTPLLCAPNPPPPSVPPSSVPLTPPLCAPHTPLLCVSNPLYPRLLCS